MTKTAVDTWTPEDIDGTMEWLMFVGEVKARQKQYMGDLADYRKGQALFNAMHDIRPDLANKVRGSMNADPFHQDDKIQAFWYAIYDQYVLTLED